jgi:hypothetical protein
MTTETLSRTALNRALLARQMLLAREKISALRAVERLVGLQAQQPAPPFVGLWTRVAGFDRAELLRLLKKRQVVRSTAMRGTLHLMSADDYLSLRGPIQPALTAARQTILRDRLKEVDVPALVSAARGIFRERPRTFTDLRDALMDTFPKGDERAMGYSVRMQLPLVAVPDDSEWGFSADPVFADAESWISKPPASGDRPDSLVVRYLGAFGPAAAADVQAWSALSGIRQVLDELRPRLRVFRDEKKRELFDLPEAPRPPEDTPAPVRFLPGFDNIVLSHADRTRIMADEHRKRVTTKNLLVLPTFLVDGFVAGTWNSTSMKASACVTLSPFARLRADAKARLAEEGEKLARFIMPQAGRWTTEFEPP